jgi:hypothetical protein
MSNEDLKKINDLAKKELAGATTMTKKESFDRLVVAGIFKRNGEYTKPYSNLSKAIKKQ